MLDGALQGRGAIRAVIGAVRERYDRQDFDFAGPWGDNGLSRTTPRSFAARRSGACIGTFSADGQAQQIAAHQLFFPDYYARGSPPLIYAERFLAGRP